MATFASRKLVIFGDSLSDNGNLYNVFGLPPAPYWKGRFSNGPTYAETLFGLVAADYVSSTIFAYGGAEAAGDRGIDLDAQLAAYLATIPVGASAEGTTAVINIGNNDYLTYDPTSNTPPPIADVLGSISSAVQALLARGVDKIVLVTLPDLGVTPRGAEIGAINPLLLQGAHLITEANNAGIQSLAAGLEALGVDVTVVDSNRLAWEVFNDSSTFGFKTHGSVFGGALNTYAPNEIAFFDDIHPTYAFHGVAASFFAASLEANNVQLLGDGRDYVFGRSGMDLVFSGAGYDVVSSGAGDDVVFAGLGNDLVYGGSGSDLLAGGGGNDALFGNAGNDILADNSGRNELYGGAGADLIIVNRLGRNEVDAGSGNDLIVVKDDIGTFVRQEISGGAGIDTLRFIAAPRSQLDLAAELQRFNDFVGAMTQRSSYDDVTFAGIEVESIERFELQIDSYDPASATTPYLITHAVVAGVGAPISVSDAMTQMLSTAELWGLLTV